MISSGRSFTVVLLRRSSGSRVLDAGARAGRARSRRRAASRPGGRCRRSGRGRRCASPRPCGPRPARSARRSPSASASESSYAVVSSTSSDPLLARRRAARTRAAISSISPARPFSASEPQEVARRARRLAEQRASSTAAFARGSSCGLRSSVAQLGDARRRPRRSRASSCADLRRAGPAPCAASKSALRVDAVRRRPSVALAPRAARSRARRPPRRSGAAGRRRRAPCR